MSTRQIKTFTPLEKYQSNFFLTRFIQKMAVTGIGAVLLFSSLAPISGYGATEPELLWSTKYDGGNTDVAYDVAVDNDNNIVVTGRSNYDYYTIKYDSSGTQLWDKRYNSSFSDQALAVTTDSNNNIIVTGEAGVVVGNTNFFTIKYDSNGNQLWTKSVGIGSSDLAYGIAVDSNNNIVVTGQSFSYHTTTGWNWDFLIVKYDNNGGPLWHKTYDNGDDRAYGVAIDSKDNVIVTGVSNGDFFTIKYDANGNELWSRTLNNGSDDTGFSVAVDPLDNIVVAGSSHILADNKDYTFLIKYDSNGRELWRRNYEGASWNGNLSVVVDSFKNIILTGILYGDYYTIASDPAGKVLWEKSYDGGGSDMSNGVTVDSLDNVIVAGYSFNGRNGDYLTLKYGYPIMLPPVASFTATPTSGEVPLTVKFTDTSTNNPTSWSWDFDNNGSVDSTLQNPSHVYTAPGIYTVSLTVSNQSGTNTKTLPNFITVTAPDTTPPIVSITEPLDNAVVQDTVVIKSTAIDDRGVNRVEFEIDNTFHSADNTSPYEYSWDTTTVSDGLHSIKAKAYDDAGKSNEAVINIRVGNIIPNRPPVLDPIGNKTIDEQQELRFTVSATDPDGDALDYSAANLPLGASFNPLTRVFSWTPDNNQSGTYPNIRFEVSDGRLTDFEDIVITVNDTVIPPPPPVNHSPIANAGSDQTVESNSFVQLNGSASFDPDNDLLTYQWTQISGQRVSLGDSNQDIASFIAPELTNAQALEFQLMVRDPGNLSSNDTAIITVKPKPEVKLAIKITQPQDSSIIAPRSKITITANVQDPGNLVKKVSFLVNHKTYRASKNRQGVYYYNWSVPYGYSKTYNIKAQAQDKQKNIVADDSVVVSSSEAPRISLTNPQNNQTVLPKTSIPITANLSPNNIGITKVEFYINSIKKRTDRNFPYFYNWRVPKENNQTYRIQAIAFTRDQDSSRDVLVGESEVTARVE